MPQMQPPVEKQNRCTQTTETLVSPETHLSSKLFQLDKQLEDELSKALKIFDKLMIEYAKMQR